MGYCFSGPRSRSQRHCQASAFILHTVSACASSVSTSQRWIKHENFSASPASRQRRAFSRWAKDSLDHHSTRCGVLAYGPEENIADAIVGKPKSDPGSFDLAERHKLDLASSAYSLPSACSPRAYPSPRQALPLGGVIFLHTHIPPRMPSES
jgi:hypothetical protein